MCKDGLRPIKTWNAISLFCSENGKDEKAVSRILEGNKDGLKYTIDVNGQAYYLRIIDKANKKDFPELDQHGHGPKRFRSDEM